MRHRKGFTLLEMLIAVALAAIIMTMAFPTYSHSRIRVERNEGRLALLRHATAQVNYFIVHGRYASDMTELGHSSAISTTEGGRFNLEMISADDDGFVIRATRIAVQTDPECRWFSVDQSHRRASGPAEPDRCWFR
ncbi:MAG: type IV pilin protein [Pseudomonadota bacterium]